MTEIDPELRHQIYQWMREYRSNAWIAKQTGLTLRQVIGLRTKRHNEIRNRQRANRTAMERAIRSAKKIEAQRKERERQRAAEAERGKTIVMKKGVPWCVVCNVALTKNSCLACRLRNGRTLKPKN